MSTISVDDYRYIAESVIYELKNSLEDGEFDRSEADDLVDMAVDAFLDASEPGGE